MSKNYSEVAYPCVSKFRNFKTLKEAVDSCPKFNSSLIEVFVVTKQNEELYTSSYMPEQPCFGGIRKYADEEHPEGCTDNAIKPLDLYYCVPPGNPVYLKVNIPGSDIDKKKDFINFLLSEESPWRLGFVEGCVEVDYKTSSIVLTFTDTNFYPTVTVNLFKFLYKILNSETHPIKILETFSSEPLKAAWAILNSCSSFNDGYVKPADTYSISNSLSFKMFVSGNANKLTEGTYYQKYDYNREKMHLVFTDDTVENNLNFPKIAASVIPELNSWDGCPIATYTKYIDESFSKLQASA